MAGHGSAAPDDWITALCRCPSCRRELARDGQNLRCSSCDLRFPIEDGIPVLLLNAAWVPCPNCGRSVPAAGVDPPEAPAPCDECRRQSEE